MSLQDDLHSRATTNQRIWTHRSDIRPRPMPLRLVSLQKPTIRKRTMRLVLMETVAMVCPFPKRKKIVFPDPIQIVLHHSRSHQTVLHPLVLYHPAAIEVIEMVLKTVRMLITRFRIQPSKKKRTY